VGGLKHAAVLSKLQVLSVEDLSECGLTADILWCLVMPLL
jgi:hypothetical protein